MGVTRDSWTIQKVELGKWKLEGELIKGIFVRPKFYIYEDLNGKVKKVAAGWYSNCNISLPILNNMEQN